MGAWNDEQPLARITCKLHGSANVTLQVSPPPSHMNQANKSWNISSFRKIKIFSDSGSGYMNRRLARTWLQ